jgi:hypothetical protein
MYVQAPIVSHRDVEDYIKSLDREEKRGHTRVSFGSTPATPANAANQAHDAPCISQLQNPVSTPVANTLQESPAASTTQTTTPSPFAPGPMLSLSTNTEFLAGKHNDLTGQPAARCMALFLNPGAANALNNIDKYYPAYRSVALADEVYLIKCSEPFEMRHPDCEVWSYRQRNLSHSVCAKCATVKKAHAKRERRQEESVVLGIDRTAASSTVRFDHQIRNHPDEAIDRARNLARDKDSKRRSLAYLRAKLDFVPDVSIQDDDTNMHTLIREAFANCTSDPKAMKKQLIQAIISLELDGVKVGDESVMAQVADFAERIYEAIQNTSLEISGKGKENLQCKIRGRN